MSPNRTRAHLTYQRAFALTLLLSLGAAVYGSNLSPVSNALRHGERVSFLLFGLDAADASRHTDTLMVGIFDPIKNKLGLLSIPRDTRVHLPGYRFRRINEVYGYHLRKSKDPKTAASEVREAVEFLLSSDEAPVSIPYFFQADFSGFGRIIDLIGGVWVRIKQPMHYDDFAGGYHFHREPGLYRLSGEEALKYVRFRGASGDRGRILRQQEFVRAAFISFANPMTILRFPKIIGAVLQSIHTNLSFWDCVFMAAEGRRLRQSDIGFYILPGAPRGAYWRVRQDAAQWLAGHLLSDVPVSEHPAEVIAPHAEEITVKVWNASGTPRLAHRVTRYLRGRGYDVVDWGNYAEVQIQSRVYDRMGHIVKAQKVADDLGISNVHSEVNLSSLADVEVVLGKSFLGTKDLEAIRPGR